MNGHDNIVDSEMEGSFDSIPPPSVSNTTMLSPKRKNRSEASNHFTPQQGKKDQQNVVARSNIAVEQLRCEPI